MNDLERRGPPPTVKENVRAHLITRAKAYQKVESPFFHLANTLVTRFEDIDIDWKIPRTPSEVKNTVGSFWASIQYAHIKTAEYEQFKPLFYTNDEKIWGAVVKNTFEDPTKKAIFRQNAWRPPITAFPERGIPLQYILTHHFDDSPITIADLGAGLGIATPLLNSSFYKTTNFPGREAIAKYARKDVNLQHAIGIDKQNGREDLEWVLACMWPIPDNKTRFRQFEDITLRLLTERGNDCPLIIADVTDLQTCESIIQQTLGTQTVDCIISSYLDQYLEQIRIQDLALDLLSPNGILIEIGAENRASNNTQAPRKINVWIKEEGALMLQNEPPFYIAEFDHIQSTNLAYFSISRR